MIAIRREDQSVWERRAPFSPAIVKKFIRNGVKVIVQPSNRRAYPMQVGLCLKIRTTSMLDGTFVKIFNEFLSATYNCGPNCLSGV